ncbi:MAG TPA: hypothetical protein PLU43_03635 [Lachnospiraceae bacterium]|nr:hypothetical protein [Lachnospiraceae bacterium]
MMGIKDKLVKIMIGVAAVVLTAVPFGMSYQIALAAETMQEDAAVSSPVQNYDLVVVQDEEVPLASAPEVNYGRTILWVVSLTVTAVLLLTYFLWYSVYKRRILFLIGRLPEAEAESIRRMVTIFHPIRAMQTEKEIENRIAAEYVK